MHILFYILVMRQTEKAQKQLKNPSESLTGVSQSLILNEKLLPTLPNKTKKWKFSLKFKRSMKE